MFRRRNTFLLTILLAFGAVSVAQTPYDLLEKGMTAIGNGDARSAVEYTNKAYYRAKESNDQFSMIKAKGNMAYISIVVGDYAAAQVNAGDAYGYLKKLDTVDYYRETLYLSYLGDISSKQGDYKRAASIYEIAYQTAKDYVKAYPDIASEYGDTDWLYSLPLDRALALKANGENEEAGDILLTLLDNMEYSPMPNTLSRVNNQIGLLKMDLNEVQSAQSFFGKAAFAEGEIDKSLRAVALHNLAWTYMEQEDYTKSKEYYQKAYEIKEEISSQAGSKFITLLDLGELEFRQKDYEEAIGYWNQALLVHEGIEEDPKAFVIYEWFDKAYTALNSSEADRFASLYTSSMADWIDSQKERSSGPELAVFSTRVDNIIAAREASARRINDLKRYWPYAAMALLVLALFIYQVQIALNKRRDRIYEQNLRTDRAHRADEILKQIRRD